MNWNCAMGFGVGAGSPMCPSFKLVKSSQVEDANDIQNVPTSVGDETRVEEKRPTTSGCSRWKKTKINFPYD
ncbi:hypothetical protein Fmac_016889 [Flemingia macrophylla]|uniref:Uncharacterized protein n=1 Tax=Flemingia macrophylla TaxID=520843 RepID=A0ABD1MIR5_9FABA